MRSGRRGCCCVVAISLAQSIFGDGIGWVTVLFAPVATVGGAECDPGTMLTRLRCRCTQRAQ